MFTSQMSAEGEIHHSVYVSGVQNWEGQQEKECLCCKEIEEAVNKISGEKYFCSQQMLITLALGS